MKHLPHYVFAWETEFDRGRLGRFPVPPCKACKPYKPDGDMCRV